MISKFDEFLLEGRYDRLTGSLVDFIWYNIKESRKSWEKLNKKVSPKQIFKLQKQTNGRVTFDFIVIIKRQVGEKPEGFVVDGYSNPVKKNQRKLDSIEIEVYLDPEFEPKCYTLLNTVLQDAVRHEIEHLTQEGKNIKSFKALPTSMWDRDFINQRNAFEYYLLPDEIDAMVQGLYRGAKTSKLPFDVYASRYLDWRLSLGDYIPGDKYSEIMNTWIEKAIELLPAVQIKQRKY